MNDDTVETFYLVHLKTENDKYIGSKVSYPLRCLCLHCSNGVICCDEIHTFISDFMFIFSYGLKSELKL